MTALGETDLRSASQESTPAQAAPQTLEPMTGRSVRHDSCHETERKGQARSEIVEDSRVHETRAATNLGSRTMAWRSSFHVGVQKGYADRSRSGDADDNDHCRSGSDDDD